MNAIAIFDGSIVQGPKHGQKQLDVYFDSQSAIHLAKKC